MKTYEEGYGEGYVAGYGAGVSDGRGQGYSDAKYRVHAAVAAADLPEACRRKMTEAVVQIVGKQT